MTNDSSPRRFNSWRPVLVLLVLAACWPVGARAADTIAVVIGKGSPPIEIRAGRELQAQLARLTGTEVTIATNVPNGATLVFFLGSPDTNTAILEHNGEIVDQWPVLEEGTSSMDHAIRQIVQWLNQGGDFPDPAHHSLHTLEVIVACHASHQAGAAWKTLPLEGEDRLLEIRSG